MSTCQRIFTSPNDEQWECQAPARWLAYGNVRFCDDCLHTVFEDEPVEMFNAHIVEISRDAPEIDTALCSLDPRVPLEE